MLHGPSVPGAAAVGSAEDCDVVDTFYTFEDDTVMRPERLDAAVRRVARRRGGRSGRTGQTGSADSLGRLGCL